MSKTTNDQTDAWKKHFKSIDETSLNGKRSISALENRMRSECSILQGKAGKQGKQGKQGKAAKPGQGKRRKCVS